MNQRGSFSKTAEGILAAWLLALILTIGDSRLGAAATVTAIYTSTVDTSAIGGSANDPLTFTVSYDTGASPYSSSAEFAAYAGSSGSLQVGVHVVNFTNGYLGISNNRSGLGDRFDVGVCVSCVAPINGSSIGAIYGRSLESFALVLDDATNLMISSLDLPAAMDGALASSRRQYLQLSGNFFSNITSLTSPAYSIRTFFSAFSVIWPAKEPSCSASLT